MLKSRREVPEQHLNPSRRKISSSLCKKESAPNSPRNSRRVNQTNCNQVFRQGILKQLNQSNKVETKYDLSRQARLADQNMRLKKEIDRLLEENSKLADKLQKQQTHSITISKDYHDLLVRYNKQLFQINSNICGSRKRSESEESEESELARRSRNSKGSKKSSGSIIKLKESFDRLDFTQIQKLANRKLHLNVDPTKQAYQTSNFYVSK